MSEYKPSLVSLWSKVSATGKHYYSGSVNWGEVVRLLKSGKAGDIIIYLKDQGDESKRPDITIHESLPRQQPTGQSPIGQQPTGQPPIGQQAQYSQAQYVQPNQQPIQYQPAQQQPQYHQPPQRPVYNNPQQNIDFNPPPQEDIRLEDISF